MSARTAEVAPPAVRRAAASAWSFRHRVELEAEVRFERLAARMERLGAAAELVALARRASADELRHAALCAEEAARLGEPVATPSAVEVPEIAPAELPLRERVLYEVVAACCISETESMAVLTTLLRAARAPELRSTLHELASDEVHHARLGWAYLTRAHAGRETTFLGPLLPAMLAGSAAPDLFAPDREERDGGTLLELGVLPRRAQRAVFTRALEQVIFPGLEGLGVDTGPARRWLAERRAEAGNHLTPIPLKNV